MSEHSGNSSSSSTPCTPFPATTIPNTTATWPNLQETIQFERAASAILNDRPHTISSGKIHIFTLIIHYTTFFVFSFPQLRCKNHQNVYTYFNFLFLDFTSQFGTIQHGHIISAYEKGHQRPPLTVYTFQAPDQSLSQPASPVTSTPSETTKIAPPLSPALSVKSLQNKPPLPTVSN